jgi:hypothetical protein
MTVTTYAKQRMAVMPSAALAGPVMLDRTGGDLAGWQIPTRGACGTTATHGFAANRSTRHLGRSST